MNRQEALTRLRLRSHQAFCEYVENGNQENEEAALDVLAYDMAIAALNEVGSPTTKLDENGLARCGCWYCEDGAMQVSDSPNKPPVEAKYCGLCGKKLEVTE